MTQIYKRLYEITVSEPIIEPDIYKVPPLISKPQLKSDNYNTTNEAKQIVITDLDFEATISKTRTGGVNELNLTIYNASDSLEAIAEQEGAIIIIKAGYESIHGNHSKLPTVFIGQTTSIEVVKEETRVVFNITANDGGEMLKNQRVSYQAVPNTPVSEVIRDLAFSFDNIVEGHLALEDIEGEVFPTGYSAFGLLKEVLSEICKSRKLKFSIEENSIYIFPDSWFRIAEQTGIIPYESTEAAAWEKNVSAAKTINFNKGQLFVFEPNTVISARRLTERRSAKTGSGKGTTGLSIKIPAYTKFNTQIDIVKLSEAFGTKVAGEYSIESLSTNLNSREGEWTTSLELTNNAKGA